MGIFYARIGHRTFLRYHECMIEKWRKELKKPSGNFTTNAPMPEHFIDTLLEEDETLKEKLEFEDAPFPELESPLNQVEGLSILAGLQRNLKDGYLTLFRAIRFPTYKRIHDVVNEYGFTTANYEQERILELYKDNVYQSGRNQIKSNPVFWTQPQERVVKGLPMFSLVNDALQIHRAYRADEDKVLMIALHIPHELVENGAIKFIANTAIDLDYDDETRDFEIKDFVKENGVLRIDYRSLRTRGIDLHEMYTQDLPENVLQAKAMGILEDLYLLDIKRIPDESTFKSLINESGVLKDNQDFMHGFFGDQNIFGRRKTTFLPTNCCRVSAK